MDENNIIVSEFNYATDITTHNDIGTVWLNTADNNVYINDGISWNTVDILHTTQEWIDAFPDFYKIEEMCKEYPALEKAYENFRTIYKMVEQDWEGKQKERNSPPF